MRRTAPAEAASDKRFGRLMDGSILTVVIGAATRAARSYTSHVKNFHKPKGKAEANAFSSHAG